MKKRPSVAVTIIIILIIIAGLSLILYPTISDMINKRNQTKAITIYNEIVSGLSEKDYAKLLEDAREYNKTLLDRENPYKLSLEQEEAYEDLLNVTGKGIMGYVEIPKINTSLPVYHGTDDIVLQRAIGHIKWSSLPVGGASTHAVLSGHRGLPSAKLFSNLDALVAGDEFYVNVLDEKLAYEVDQILVVEPTDLSALKIVEGEDYCTLVTCTPYGVNTHRLLVRGHRIDIEESDYDSRVTSEAVTYETVFIASIVAIPFLILVIVGIILHNRDKKKKKK